MSYMYYSVFGSIVTVFVGTLVSLFTTTEDYDSNLIHPVLSRFVKKQPSAMHDEKPRQVIVNSLSVPEKVREKY